jgi:predicted dehydrogenase
MYFKETKMDKESIFMEVARKDRLQHVVIGVGAGIFKSHQPALTTLPSTDLIAVSDINKVEGKHRAEELHCAFYEDYRQMLAETQPDVAVILTPPFLHARVAIDCLQAGCHVLTEKPMAIQVAEADAMIEAAQRNQRLLAVMLQHRFRPEVIAAHKLLLAGTIGDVQRIELSAVWTRPSSYYTMAAWRATWAGEGGGVLTNQASHNLDVLCHLVGSPARVFAWTRRLLHKQIETEDTVQAMLEWSNGALGALHISTAEADDDERLKIVGTRGLLEISHGILTAQTLAVDMTDYALNADDPYAKPERYPYNVTLEPGKADFTAVYRNFHAAILHGSPLSCDGISARMELELANAIIYSSYKHQEIELPLDRQGYAHLLKALQAG